MVDGLHLNPIDNPRPAPDKEVKGRDANSANGNSGATSAAAVAPGMGPPAPDPTSGSSGHEENQERDSKARAQNADEMGKSLSGEKSNLQPGEERVADIPDKPGFQLAIRVDEDLNKPIFQIRESETGEVVREVPSKEMVELSKKMPDLINGLMINDLA